MIYDCDLHMFQYKMKLIIINYIFILHTLHMYSMLYLYILRLTMFVMLCKIIFFYFSLRRDGTRRCTSSGR